MSPDRSGTNSPLAPQAHLWKAVRDQAEAWRAETEVARFVEALPRNASQRNSGVPGRIQELVACGADSHPLRMGSNLPHMQRVVPNLINNKVNESDWRTWLQRAQRIEAAHRETIAWLRSRLPGYPFFPSPPQLQPNTSLTSNEYTSRLAWQANERRRGLQLQPNPDANVSRLLGASSSSALDRATREVGSALLETSEVKRFEQASCLLDDDARTLIKNANREIRTRLSPSALDDHEPRFALPREAFRMAVLTEEIEKLAGPAAEFVRSFEAVDRLMERACSDVFGQVLAYGPPSTVKVTEDIDLDPGPPRHATFVTHDEVFVQPGEIFWPESGIVQDAVQVIGTEMHLASQSSTLTLSTVVLEGTAEAWKAAT